MLHIYRWQYKKRSAGKFRLHVVRKLVQIKFVKLQDYFVYNNHWSFTQDKHHAWTYSGFESTSKWGTHNFNTKVLPIFLSQIKMYQYIISIGSLVRNTDQYFCTYLVILVGSLQHKDNCTSSPNLVRFIKK